MMLAIFGGNLLPRKPLGTVEADGITEAENAQLEEFGEE
jgi:hypothetical protein